MHCGEGKILWSSTQNDSYDNNAYNLNFNSGNANWNWNNNKSNGLTVRPVAELSVNISKTMERQQLMEDLLQAYYEARRNKRNTINQLRFEFNMEHEIISLCDEIL